MARGEGESRTCQHEGQGSGSRYMQCVHRLGHEEFTYTGPQHRSSVKATAERRSTTALQLQFVAFSETIDDFS